MKRFVDRQKQSFLLQVVQTTPCDISLHQLLGNNQKQSHIYLVPTLLGTITEIVLSCHQRDLPFSAPVEYCFIFDSSNNYLNLLFIGHPEALRKKMRALKERE
jgi:hypothetical protein